MRLMGRFAGTIRAGEAIQEGGLLAARIVETQCSAHLLEAIPAELRKHLGHRGLSQGRHGLNEVVLLPPIRCRELESIDHRNKLVPAQQGQHVALGWHQPHDTRPCIMIKVV
jgi:hypothetical protein